MDQSQAFSTLSPDDILNAVEAVGYRCNGRIFALNSYENRVYEIGVEEEAPLIAKFYRPGRWNDEAILEEHRFSLRLEELEIPAVAPVSKDGRTLFHVQDFRFALYPRVGGRTPELDDPDHLLQLGRTIARIHNVGAVMPFKHRPGIDIRAYAVEPSAYLLENGFLPADIENAYRTLIQDLTARIERRFGDAGKVDAISLHGDCHLGNILWRDDTPLFVDFDDARTGPAVQDLWMLLSGDRPYMTARLNDLLEGYTEFREFNARELHLIEPLRTLRMIHYAGWLARRWDDPAFPMAFPWFNTQRYWEDHILSLREQAAMLDEPPLEWMG